MSVPGLKGLRLEECDPFKEFRAVMTEEHRNMIASGLSDEDMLMLMEELQDRLRAKQRLAMRARRARFTEEQREAERIKNRERKRMVRQNPLLEFKRIMTDEQRKLLLQPNLDPLKRAGIIAELVAIRKWIQREQARERRARLSEDKKSEVRRKSREYKRKARNNPLQAFRCVMTEKHYELLQQDLDQEQREGLITELIELKKAKQREETRARRAGFSPEQKERERKYSREYKRMQRQRGPAVINYQYDGDSEAGAQSTAIPDQPPMVRPDLTFHRNQNIHPGTGRISLETPSEQMYQDAARQKIEETKVRNRERQRLKRAMQTEEEKEEERRKNRERSRLRRMKLAEEARTHYLAKLHLEDLPMEEERDHGNLHEQNLRTGQTIPAKPYEQTDTGVKSELDRPHGIMPEDKMMFDAPTHGQAESVITNPQTPKMVQPICAPWFSEALLLNIRKRNRESTQRSRANMTEEQREMERARNRERQRLKRLMQTPEERAAYALKQKLERRRRRQDPRYRERERQRQRERKKQMRQFPWYRARENDLCYLRKARQAGTSPRSSVSSAVEVGQGYENTSPKEGEERGEGSRDEGAFYVDVNVPKQGQDIGGEEHPREGPQQDDERLGKISGSVFGMHRIEPLNTMPGKH
ncbi:uncharacterized protein [Diadema setosum]|uniref:uncharacterized protein n=1 Tax=Diadema setosum TaxID=31175 RepID=UPI003B3A6DCD